MNLPVLPNERMASALAALALARGGLIDEAQVVVYLRLMADADTALVERACEAIAREPRDDFDPVLPSVGAILERAKSMAASDAKVAAAARLLPMPKSDEDGPRYFCLDCFDEPSGWRIHQCAGWQAPVIDARTTARLEGLDGRHCGRRTVHHAHSFSERCHCWQYNPVVAERKKRLERHA